MTKLRNEIKLEKYIEVIKAFSFIKLVKSRQSAIKIIVPEKVENIILIQGLSNIKSKEYRRNFFAIEL
ncbi:MAG: hypothetical protein DCF13_13570 [Flavobacteriaceae bacterium]|nr:MAG: hypothetical protein DCF13_13570 [Flavobacteriaceae bacterium]